MDDSTVDVIAHRCFAGAFPENTVAAARAAAGAEESPLSPALAADVVEVDVLPTADGDVVACHDHRLGEREGETDGLTDAEGVVWQTDTETVTSARVLGTDETVPLLSELLDAVPSDVGVNVELKNPGSFELAYERALDADDLARQQSVWRPFVEAVLDVLEDHRHDVLVSSFHEAALACTVQASDYPVAPLFWEAAEDALEIARRYDAAAIHPPYTAIRGTPFADAPDDGPALLAVARAEGYDVNVYTVTTWYQAEQLAAAGVDGLIAEYPCLHAPGVR